MLYKFHRFNNFLFNLFIDSTLWFANPKDFNDPFDMQFSSDLNYDSDSKEDIIAKELANYDLSKLGINESQLLADIDKQFENFDPKEQLNSIIYQGFQNMGMCCFSKKFDDILLWSHYTDGHYGICIEFDETELAKVERTFLFQMEYNDDFPHAKEASELKKAFRKSKCWEYEEEYRLIHPTKGAVKFPKKSIKRIIFGAKTELSDLNRIINLVTACGYENIKFLKASIHPYQYKLNYSEIS